MVSDVAGCGLVEFGEELQPSIMSNGCQMGNWKKESDVQGIPSKVA